MNRQKDQKISVCMATRNGEKYIKEQLESILKQLNQEDEVVISDDSSNDGTVQIINQFGDERIRFFKNNAFHPAFNFENALKRATGDIIVLSDQDDIWLDQKISVIRENFLQTSSPFHLVVLDGEIIDANGEVIGKSIFEKINSGGGVLKNLYDNTYLGCCMAFSRQLLDIALPFPKRIPMHDMWLGLLAQLFGTVEFLNVKTIRYRKHSESTTDFRRQFKPILQIKRRIFLAGHLGLRYLERKCLDHSGTTSRVKKHSVK